MQITIVGAKAPRIDPAAKTMAPSCVQGLRPKMWLSAAKIGIMMEDARKNAVPVQNDWSAVPLRSPVNAGRAMLRDVASRAAARVNEEIATKAI